MDKLKEHLKDETIILLVATALVGAVIVASSLRTREDEPADAECKETLAAEGETFEEVSDTPESIQVETKEPMESEATEEVKPELPIEEEAAAGTEETAKDQGSLEESEISEETEALDASVSISEPEETTEDVEKPEAQEKLPNKEPEEEVVEEETETAETPVLQPEEKPEGSAQPGEHEHSWIFESYYQKSTCSNGGLVNQICARCGETQTTGGTPTGEHQFSVETPGDCCSAEVVICSECNHREVREKDPDNHIDEEDGFCYGCGCETE